MVLKFVNLGAGSELGSAPLGKEISERKAFEIFYIGNNYKYSS